MMEHTGDWNTLGPALEGQPRPALQAPLQEIQFTNTLSTVNYRATNTTNIVVQDENPYTPILGVEVTESERLSPVFVGVEVTESERLSPVYCPQVANCIERDPGDSNVDPMSADEFDPMSADECDSGSEYDPSDMEESSDSSGSGDEDVEHFGDSGDGFQNSGVILGCSNLCGDKLEQRDECKVSQRTGKGWDKKNCCVYCTRCYPKLARHFEQKHADELDVACALGLPKGSKQRKRKWEELRNKGNFHHNQKVLKDESGDLLPRKRPSKE